MKNKKIVTIIVLTFILAAFTFAWRVNDWNTKRLTDEYAARVQAYEDAKDYFSECLIKYSNPSTQWLFSDGEILDNFLEKNPVTSSTVQKAAKNCFDYWISKNEFSDVAYE